MKRHQRGTLLSSLPAGLSGAIAGGCIPEREYDIVIYGGGSSGFIAAVQGAKLGKSVALVEPGNRLGGINVEGLGGTDIDNHNEFQNSPKFSFKGAQNLRNWERQIIHQSSKAQPLIYAKL